MRIQFSQHFVEAHPAIHSRSLQDSSASAAWTAAMILDSVEQGGFPEAEPFLPVLERTPKGDYDVPRLWGELPSPKGASSEISLTARKPGTSSRKISLCDSVTHTVLS